MPGIGVATIWWFFVWQTFPKWPWPLPFSPAVTACFRFFTCVHICVVLVFDGSCSSEKVVARRGPDLCCDQWIPSLRILPWASSPSSHSNPWFLNVVVWMHWRKNCLYILCYSLIRCMIGKSVSYFLCWLCTFVVLWDKDVSLEWSQSLLLWASHLSNYCPALEQRLTTALLRSSNAPLAFRCRSMSPSM